MRERVKAVPLTCSGTKGPGCYEREWETVMDAKTANISPRKSLYALGVTLRARTKWAHVVGRRKEQQKQSDVCQLRAARAYRRSEVGLGERNRADVGEGTELARGAAVNGFALHIVVFVDSRCMSAVALSYGFATVSRVSFAAG